MAIVLRSSQLDPLTHTELDGNFEFLDTKVTSLESTLSNYNEVPAGTNAGDTIYWDGSEWKVTGTLNADTVTDGVYTTGNQTIDGVKTFTSTISGSIDGSAPLLENARKINGTDFNGSSNIVTDFWGRSRLITIGGTAKSVDGRENVEWLPSEIDANNANLATVALKTYGELTIDGVVWDGSTDLSVTTGSPYVGADAVKLTGDQTVAGVKTFTDLISGSVDGNAATADLALVANTAGKVGNKLTINGIDYDGSTDVVITTTDANSVQLDGNQTITGIKTFSDTTEFQDVTLKGSGNQLLWETDGGGLTMLDNLWLRTLGTSGFYVSGGGTLASTGNIVAYYSDERLKEKEGVIADALDKVSKIETFLYRGNDLAKEFGYTDDKVEVGVSAQSVEAVLPQVVSLAPFDYGETSSDGVVESKTGDNYRTVDYGRLTVLLIEAIKEIKEKIEAIESEVR